MTSLNLATTNRAEAEEALRALYAVAIDPPEPGQRFSVHFTSNPVGAVALIRSRFAMRVGIHGTGPMAETVVGRLRHGELAYRVGDHDNRWRAGNVFVAVPAGSGWDSVVRDCDLDAVAFAPGSLDAVAQTADGRPVALTGFTPVSRRAADHWSVTTDYARQVASGPTPPPLVAGATARLLAATTLATFPHNAVIDPTIEERHDAHPRTVRRAVAFIETHPDVDLTVVEIARAANVTPRALQLAFRRHLDTTPMAYLRRVRLDRAHAELLDADPDGTTVTAIAGRWGVANPGRVAADYAEAVGSSPSAVLRGRPGD